MNEVELVKMLGQSGIAVGALYVLARIVWRVGERMIAAIDRVGQKIDDHTKADTAALAAVSTNVSSLRQDIAVLSASVDTVIEWSGSERTVKRNTPIPMLPQGDERQTGEYRHHRPPKER